MRHYQGILTIKAEVDRDEITRRIEAALFDLVGSCHLNLKEQNTAMPRLTLAPPRAGDDYTRRADDVRG